MLKVFTDMFNNLSCFHIFFILIIMIILYLTINGCYKEGFEDASSALPEGIKKKEIPEGDEDLYIKKTEIVPPVCPRCPDLIQKDMDTSKCPPCPSCKRCPAPAEVECKKVFKAKDKNLIDKEEVNIDVAFSETKGKVSKLPTTGPLDLMNDKGIEVGSLLTENNKPQNVRPLISDFSNF